MGASLVNQTVGGLSLAILLTLVIFAYGYPYTVNTEEEAKAPFGEDTKLFWNIFVGLTALVLILVVVVGFVAPCDSVHGWRACPCHREWW